MNVIFRYLKVVVPLFILTVITTDEVKSQISNYFISGAKKGEVDTLQLETTQKIVKESSGLLEKEIDPNTYVLGPNDIFTISIISAKPYNFEAIISPEGKLLIPNVGTVSLKGKSLTEAEQLIIERVHKVYKTDEVYITLSELRKFKVTVSGEVRKPNIVSATSVDRVSEVIEKAGGLQFDASIRNIILLRENKHIAVDLVGYFRGGKESANPTVLGGDQIIVPKLNAEDVIGIYGEVSSPELFEYVKGDSLSSLFKYGLGFTHTALLDSVEIARFRTSTEIERWIVDLSSWDSLFLKGEALPNDIPLHSGDRVFVRKKTIWPERQTVAIKGEVNYPGYYAVEKGKERISDIIIRAGGVTSEASLESAFLIRKKEFDIEDKEMERLWRIPPAEMSESELKYFLARVREIKGLMAINFNKAINEPSSEDNVYLQDKDSIFIPVQRPFVNVQGRVANPGLVIYNENYKYLDYIALSGGFGYRADENETIIVKSKGEQFLASSMNYTIEPGDNILVPPTPEVSTWKIIQEGFTFAAQVVSIVGVIIALTR